MKDAGAATSSEDWSAPIDELRNRIDISGVPFADRGPRLLVFGYLVQMSASSIRVSCEGVPSRGPVSAQKPERGRVRVAVNPEWICASLYLDRERPTAIHTGLNTCRLRPPYVQDLCFIDEEGMSLTNELGGACHDHCDNDTCKAIVLKEGRGF